MTLDDGKVLLVANPAAQHGNGAQAARVALDLLQQWLGEGGVDFVATERPAHATEIASSASNERYASVVALGGDGIVHEVVNGLMRLPKDKRPRFGLIPVGSGNDYARTLGMSECVPDAVVQFLDACEHVVDVGCCNGEYFAETLSFGLDAAIALDTVQRRERTGEQGTVLYLKSGIDQLLHHLDLFEFHAELDGGRTLSGDVHMFAVQNGPTYGGGFRICPKASVQDGLLDICYAKGPMNMFEAMFKFLSAKNAHHVRRGGICFARTSKLKLSFDRRPPCQIDGEAHIADSYEIEAVPGALRVLMASSR